MKWKDFIKSKWSGYYNFHEGDWNVLDDLTGRKVRQSQTTKEWDGFRSTHSLPRHPQDFIRSHPERIRTPWSRPESEDTFVNSELTLPTIPLPLIVWFDAADTSTIIESSNLSSQWNDKSGNAFNISQSTGAAQPTTNTTTLNGRNVIDFDGNDDFMENDSDGILIQLTDFDYTLFSVFTLNATLDEIQAPYAWNRKSTNFNNTVYYVSDTTGLFTHNSNPIENPDIVLSTSDIRGATTLVSVRTDLGGNIVCNINGAQEASETLLTPGQDAEAFVVGGEYDVGDEAEITNLWHGSIAEIVIYSGILSLIQIKEVEAYLAEKWGITLVS